jgi:hypothetical protein
MSTTVSHVWKPSHARLVTVDSFIPVPRGTTADIGPAIVGNDGDGIATLSVTVAPSNPGDLVAQSTTADGSRVVLWLSEGQAGTIYTVTFSITTVNGRSLQRTVLLPVLMLSIPAVPPNALVTTAGVVLTDQNGNPVLSGD